MKVFTYESNATSIKIIDFPYFQRFVDNEFTDEHTKTRTKMEHFPSLILNESLFELKLIDLPVIPYFPPDSFSEWSDYRFYGLRSASAYLLVYDVSVPSSFHFVKVIREQIYESRDMTNIPVIVVANKMDLVATNNKQNLNIANKEAMHSTVSISRGFYCHFLKG